MQQRVPMRDRFGLVPPHIRARYEKAEWVDRATTAGKALEAELKSVYGPEMEVVLVGPRVRPGEGGVPESVVPGRWHVRRNNPPPAIPTYIAILAPGGGYRDPDFGVVAELAEIDLRRPGVKERLMQETRTDAPHKQHERDLRKEQRFDEMHHNFKAAKRVRGEGGLKKSFAGKRSKAQKRYEEAKA